MSITDIIQAIFRWAHIVAGIVWIGHLYFFNFVNGPFQATIDGPTKKAVNPELLPRALFWFRWGAAWTWATGVILLLVVFYHGQLMGFTDGWTMGALVMVLLTFIAPFIYDAVAKMEFAKNNQTMAGVGFVLIVITVLLYIWVGGFGYRAYVIHTGSMLGTIMAYNVWFRIWPAQQQIIAAVKQGTPPDQALVGRAGTRSRHNTYMSVPLVWTMIDQHTAGSFAGSFISLLIAVGVGWWFVTMFYRQAGTVKGF